jgi:hypothetical protein
MFDQRMKKCNNKNMATKGQKMPTPVTTNYYDFNLWAPEDTMLTLSAYEFEYNTEGDLATNNSKWTTLELPVNPENMKAIKWLLHLFFGDENYGVYQDMDAWDGDAGNFHHESTPAVIREWALALPEYTYQ